MTHGENVPVQIAEYAQLSRVTTIVIGQSNVRQNHIFSRQTLTEKLISLIPDIDIHIIPDTFRHCNLSNKPHLPLYTEKPSVKDILADHIDFCRVYADWSGISKASFYRYEYCDHLYAWRIAYLHFDQWISLQSCGFFFKCRVVLLFSLQSQGCLFRPMQ